MKSKASPYRFGPFLLTAIGWLLIFCLIAASTAHPERTLQTFSWMLTLWALAVLNLFALSKLAKCLLDLTITSGEKRRSLIIQTSYWTILKLVSLGLILMVISKGQVIPMVSYLGGLGVLAFSPLVGGFISSQRALADARQRA